jgi:tRNA threonylcarbamoyladenosine biosynthesis protein TsaB
MISLLALEASTEACSVALLHNGKLVEDFRMLPRAHTQFLLPMVDEILRGNELRLQDLDGIAFAVGPGSFTGLRVCAGVVQGLAFAAEKPVIAISTLQAMAQHAVQDLGLPEAAIILPALDARMDEVYWGHYCVRDGFAHAVAEDRLSAPEALLLSLQDSQQVTGGGAVGIGSGWQYCSRIALALPASNMHIETYPRASAVLSLAEQAFARGELLSAEEAQPVYLRDSVAWQKSS